MADFKILTGTNKDNIWKIYKPCILVILIFHPFFILKNILKYAKLFGMGNANL